MVKWSNGQLLPLSQSVFVTLALSIFSGGFGIAKFMKTGPCKMVPSTSGFLDGFVSLGFPAVVFSVIATIVGKGLLLPVVSQDVQNWSLSVSKVAMWMALNLLPQFIYVSTISNETIIVHTTYIENSGGSKGLIFSKVAMWMGMNLLHLHM